MTLPPLKSLDDALAALLPAARAVTSAETLSLDDARGRVLASTVNALRDVPPADNSAMDGFAVRCDDAGRTVPVSQRVAAGDNPAALEAGKAARIFTGGVIPAGADAVVLQEDCQYDDERVELPGAINRGQHIRRRGQDTHCGAPLLPGGRRLRPQDLGLLASQGIDRVEVLIPLEVALLSSGSELVEAGAGELAPGQIFNSNRPMLSAMLQALGCRVLDLGIVPDTPEATAEALVRAAQADLVISSGGVSVGEADHVRDQVARLGSIDLWRVAIKPGKPFAFGRVGETAFLGLPGNPSSAFVTFVLLARPFIAAMQGRVDHPTSPCPVRADFSADAGGRTEFLRASLELRDGELWATPFANQSSGVLSSVCESDALVIVPRGETVRRGARIDALRLDELLN